MIAHALTPLLAFASLGAWIGLVAFRNGFWADATLLEQEVLVRAKAAQRHDREKNWPRVVAIVPARNEAETIAPVVKAHLASDYPGDFSMLLVDDQSDDGTAEIAQKAIESAAEGAPDSAKESPNKTAQKSSGRSDFLRVIKGSTPPEGWSGKVWALQQGYDAALRMRPPADYVLLTDADILHAPGSLRLLVSTAEYRGLALLSLMARLDARGFWGGLLVPAFIFFFQKLYPFPAANEPANAIAAAAGGCVLLRAKDLEAIGGFGAISDALIDDCALAAAMKAGGDRRCEVYVSDDTVVSLRDNRRLDSIWTMVARTAFTQLDYSWRALAVAIAGLALVYLVPPLALLVGLFSGDTAVLLAGATATLLMARAYRPTAQLYRVDGWRLFLLPVAASLYMGMTIDSALRHARGRGGAWKGRTFQKRAH